MERKGIIHCNLLIISCITLFTSCLGSNEESIRCSIQIIDDGYATRAADPDENKITDISLMVFDEDGDAQTCIWIQDGKTIVDLELIKGKKYSFRSCINFGYQVYADHIDELYEPLPGSLSES